MLAAVRRRWPLVLLAALPVLGQAPAASSAARPTTYIEAVDFVTPRIGYAVIARGTAGSGSPPVLYRTVDAGGHWAEVPGGLPSHARYPFLAADIGFSTTASGVALMSMGVGACQAGWDVYRTGDGGRTWRAAGEIIGSDGPAVVAAVQDGVPWMLNGSCAGGYATLFRGFAKEWPEAHQFALSAAAAKAYISPSAVSLQRYGARRALVVVAYYPELGKSRAPLLLGYATASGGASWQPVALGARGLAGTVSAVAFYSPAEGLAVTRSRGGRQALYSTRDGGARWLPVHGVPIPPSDYGASIQWVNAKVADLLLGRSLWRTTDGGRTWHVLTSRWPN